MASQHGSPLVTIAIPTYNRADRYLREALESARTQTYPRLEIIVSDNCSSDGTPALVTSIADSRLRYFRHPTNVGSNRNCNFCLQEATGEYFLLLCDDDLIDADFIETCMTAGPRPLDPGIIRTGVRLIDAKGRVLHEMPNMIGGRSTDAFFREWLAGRVPFYLCNTLFHTRRLREIGGFLSKHCLYDDVMAAVRLAAAYGRVDVPDVKASARQHESKLGFTADIGEWCEDSLLLLDLMCQLATEDSALIRREGMRTFARRNYSRAAAIRSPLRRLMAYVIVFRMFHYRYPPPLHLRRRLHPRRLKRLLQMG
jgi:glycosyltransferase involved in cell wall biosynthesis